MIHIPSYMAKALSLALIPKAISMVEEVYDSSIKYWFNNEDDLVVKPRKKYDRTPLNNEQLSVIVNAHRFNQGLYKKDRLTYAQFTLRMNEQLGLDKSRAFYYRVCNSKPIIGE